ncbi:cadherin-like domain-containing protein [Waterburya agarophytonicola K14]|uniref:Cadherin-like domain-containing protein n=1 Tax=Waterburya agarophytonicola KI4 TaxID=2874699 RepID=A0A964BUS1_9CYAN|nr:cadherin-like domain-containing protein [Waterburya agarophytonicola]MCC0178517.1 cadherin-like domain-containing protein [Waterburya agarophytonicola KI4]
MTMFNTGTFSVDEDGQIEVDYLFDGGWFRGELAVFSLKGMEDYEPGSESFIQEAARRVLTNSKEGKVILQDDLEGAKFSTDLPWERDFNTGQYQGVKTFNLTPGDEVALMLVQHTTVQETWENPGKTGEFGKQVIFSLPEANLSASSMDGYEVIDVNGNGTIAFEDVPIFQADKDYNDLIIDLQGLEGNLPTLSDNINQTRDWRKTLILYDRKLQKLSDDELVMHLEFDLVRENTLPDSSPLGGNNPGKLSNGAEFSNGRVDLGDRNDIIKVADSQDINLGTHSQRTVSLWFKVDNKNIGNGKQIIYEEGGFNGGDAGLNIYIENSRLYFGGWNRDRGNWAGTYLSSDAIYADTWHHAVLVLDAEAGVGTTQPEVLTAYLDGVKIGVGSGIELTSHTDNVGLGGLNETTRFHNGVGQTNEEHSSIGSLADARIYNRALTESEISLLYNPNHAPVAKDDLSTTIENSEVIIFAIDLLANDTDLDGNTLNLVSVDNAIDGNVSLDLDGNIIFAPEPNFSGEASFEYTISDDVGEIDTAQVTVNVLPAKDPIALGTNLHPLAEWSPQLPFINAFKTARKWIPQDWDRKTKYRWYPNIWDTGEFKELDLDENGWVKSLPAPEDSEQYTSVGTIMYRNVGEYPAGKYVVLYEGEGSIVYGLDAVKDETASTTGRDVIDVNPSNAGIWLRITQTDPNETGDYIKDIKVIHEDYEYASNQTFNPEFLEKVQLFDTIRFMDWMETNNSHQGEWSTRPTPDNSLFFGGVASVEDMVELANRTQTNPWFNMPHQATDEYIANFANYVKENLDPELKVYVEYSNEVWGGLAQGWWVEQQGKSEFADSKEGNFAKRIDWFSKRTTEITQIWDEVYGEEKERVIGVMGVQAANLWTGRRALDYAWTDNPLDHEEYGIDAVGIGPYFGRYLGKPYFASQMEAWLDDDDPDLPLDNLFQEITEGGILQHTPKQGALQEAYDWTSNYVTLAEEQDLDLLAYEGSQHVTGIYGTQYNQAIANLFIEANQDPRMGEIYQEYFTTLDELGVDLAVNHNDVSPYNRWGSWGTLENIHQEDSPKYNALKSLTAKSNLPPVLGELETNLADLNILLEGESLELGIEYTDVGLTDYHSIEFDWDDGSVADVEEKEPLLGDLGEISGSHIYQKPGIYSPTVTITDNKNLTSSKSLTVSVAQKVEIDWNPDVDNSDIDITGNGNIKVAILGRSNFDPATIDPTTIRADDEREILLNGRDISAIANDFVLKDSNSDGFLDLEITFSKSSLRNVVDVDLEPFVSQQQIYLFGSSSSLAGGFFLGTEELRD